MSEHRTFIATDYPAEIIVRPVEPIGQPGAWFRMWESTVFSGLLARLSGGEVRLFWAIAAHHQRDGHLCIAPESALCQYTGRSLYQIRTARRALCSRDGGRICIHHGGDVYELMPDEPLLGRRSALPLVPDRRPTWPLTGDDPPDPSGENPTRKLGKRNGELGKPHAVTGNTRAPNPTQEIKTETGLGEVHPSGFATVAAIERAAKARQLGKRGWVGFPLFWTLDGILCPRLALGLLEVGDADRDHVLTVCKGLTVAEIDTEARSIASDLAGVNRPARLLCYRLCRNHGQRMPGKRQSVRAENLEAMRAARVAEARRAAGGER